MKIKYLKFKNWLLTAMAAVLGINMGCERMFTAEYGTPSARYGIKGTVSDEAGAPIKGIEVNMNWSSTLTGDDGRYSMSIDAFPYDEVGFHVAFNDVDSTENGYFQNDTVQVTFKRSELSGGDGNWDEGSAIKTLNMTLKPKE